MPTYDGIGSSITHEIEVVGDVFISNVEGGSLSTQVPFEIFSNVYGMATPPTDSRQVRLRVQPTTQASPDDSYVSDMGIQNTTDNYFFITAPQNTSSVGDQNTFVISKTSNVGIGTTNPEKPLHVVGDSWVTGTLTASNIIGASPITISSNLVMASGFTLTAGAIDGSSLTVTGDVQGASASLGAIDGSSLAVSGPISASNMSVSTYIYHTGDTNTYMGFVSPDTIVFNTSGSEKMRIRNTGLVGIGTDSPIARLEVNGTSINDGVLSLRYALVAPSDGLDDSPWYGMSWSNRANNLGVTFERNIPVISGYEGVALRSRAGILRMTNGGSVGIGITNPSAKLHVDGTIQTSDITQTTPVMYKISLQTNQTNVNDTTTFTIRDLFATSSGAVVQINSGGTFTRSNSTITLPSTGYWRVTGNFVFTGTGQRIVVAVQPYIETALSGEIFVGDYVRNASGHTTSSTLVSSVYDFAGNKQISFYFAQYGVASTDVSIVGTASFVLLEKL